MHIPDGTQRPGHLGPRPTPRADGYQNAPLDRDTALNILIDAGEVLSIAGPCRIDLRPSGKGYDAVLPVEMLLVLVAVLHDQSARIAALRPA